MKNLNELLQEKQKFTIGKDKANEKYYNFNKPTHPDMEQMKEYKKLLREGNEQQAKEYYIGIKEITEKNRLEKKELEKKKNIYQLAYEMININIITAFENLHKEEILNVLNKYVKKRVGEKTKEKIENEIKALDENIKSCYLDIKYDMFGKNEIILYYGNFDFEIKINFYEVDNWLNENGEKINDICNYTTANYKYIDDILQLAKEKTEEKEKLEEETEKAIKKLKEKIRSFNNFYCYSENKFKIDEYSIFR